MKPQVVAAALNDLLADDAIISTDSGTITTWAARYIQMKRGQMFSCSGNLATMAPGCPTRSPRRSRIPGRQSVAFVGDGGFTMLMGEFATAVKYRLPIKVVIIKNNVLGMIKWEQMVFLGNPEYGVALEPIDFVKFAEACGGVGFRCERPEEARSGARSDDARRRSGAVRGDRRSVRAADAGARHGEAGAAHGRVAGARRAQSRPHRAHAVPRQGERSQRAIVERCPKKKKRTHKGPPVEQRGVTHYKVVPPADEDNCRRGGAGAQRQGRSVRRARHGTANPVSDAGRCRGRIARGKRPPRRRTDATTRRAGNRRRRRAASADRTDAHRRLIDGRVKSTFTRRAAVADHRGRSHAARRDAVPLQRRHRRLASLVRIPFRRYVAGSLHEFPTPVRTPVYLATALLVASALVVVNLAIAALALARAPQRRRRRNG